MNSISLLGVKIHNFRSVRYSEITFPQTPGLRFLGGQNLEEPQLGANGAGKSTLWEAVFWCLYGTGTKGARTSVLLSWKATEVTVEIRLRINEVVWHIKRTGPPNKLFVNGIETSQPGLDTLLGLSKLRFQHAVIFSQGQRLFADLTIPERGEVLEEILNLTLWTKCVETTSTTLTSLTKEVFDVKQTWSKTVGQLAEIETTESLLERKQAWEDSQAARLASIQKQAANWEWEQKNKIAQTELEIHNFAATQMDELHRLQVAEGIWADDVQEQGMSAITNLDALEGQLKGITTFLADSANSPSTEQISRQLVNKRTNLAVLASDMESKLNHIAMIDNQIAFWETTKYCSACRQPITIQHSLDCRKELFADRDKVAQKLARDRERVEPLKEEIKELEQALAAASVNESFVASKKAEERSINAQIARLEKDAEILLERRGVSPYVSQIEAVKNRKNPYALILLDLHKEKNPHTALYNREKSVVNPIEETIRVTEARRKILEQMATEQDHIIKRLESKAIQVEYWKHGFKRLRVFLMQRVLAVLDLEINTALHTLGLQDWSISLKSETETKSGTVKLGIQISIVNPNKIEAPWESWSGGESQRLRSAITLGLASLIQRASGVWWNLEVFDEPTQHLSQEGVEDLLEVLTYRAETKQKPVWICDHVAPVYSGFTDLWTAIKEKDTGTRFQTR